MSGQYSTETILGEGYTYVNHNHTAYEVEQQSDNLQGLTIRTINGNMVTSFILLLIMDSTLLSTSQTL